MFLVSVVVEETTERRRDCAGGGGGVKRGPRGLAPPAVSLPIMRRRENRYPKSASARVRGFTRNHSDPPAELSTLSAHARAPEHTRHGPIKSVPEIMYSPTTVREEAL